MPAPVTTKDSGNGCAVEKGLSWGHSAMQGWRVSMEDAHLALAELPSQDWRHVALFGVMDGHGGEQVAHFCEKYLPAEIASGSSEDMGSALIDAFHKMDEMLIQPERLEELRSLSNPSLLGNAKSWNAHPDRVGCTACICCVTSNSLVVANCGDSRAVLCRNGQAVPLSEDHKPTCPIERQRIQKAGGTIERTAFGNIVQFRVNGGLNLSRSIGDLSYKKDKSLQPQEQMICATPDVQVYPREAGDEFFVVCCDGVWDVMGCQDVIDFVRERLPKRSQGDTGPTDPKVLIPIMEELLDNCISPDLSKTSGLGGDNMTALVVILDTCQTNREAPKAAGAAGAASVLQQVQAEKPDDQSMSLVDDKAIMPQGLLCGWQQK